MISNFISNCFLENDEKNIIFNLDNFNDLKKIYDLNSDKEFQLPGFEYLSNEEKITNNQMTSCSEKKEKPQQQLNQNQLSEENVNNEQIHLPEENIKNAQVQFLEETNIQIISLNEEGEENKIEKFICKLEIKTKNKINKKSLEEIVGEKIEKNKNQTKNHTKISKYSKNNITNQKNSPTKLGRKKKGDTTESPNNRYTGKNMWRAIKRKLFKYSLDTINTIFDSYLNEDIKNLLNSLIKSTNDKSNNNNYLLKRLGYQIIKDNKKENELNFFKMKFKEIFKYKISGDFKIFPEDSNIIIIETIESNYNQIHPIISFILDLQFEEWIDFFTYKKEIEEFENIEKEKNLKIKRANVLLDEIAEKNDEKYTTLYFFHLNYYKQLFSLKETENKK